MKASRAYGKRLMKKGWNDFANATRESIERGLMPANCELVFKNNMFVVQVYMPRATTWGTICRVGCRKNDGSPNVKWSEMQRIKNELFGPEAEAVQVFPKESELVDQANMFWFFVIKNGVPFDFYGAQK